MVTFTAARLKPLCSPLARVFMKTRSLFLSLVLAVVCLQAPLPQGCCQVVGYINVPISVGYNFVANQFDATDNTITNVISPSGPPVGSAVYLWSVTNQAYAPPSVLTTNGWTVNFNLPPPTGFVISSPSTWTLVFTGKILQGTFTTPYPGAAKFSLLASAIPLSQALGGTNMAFPPLEGENVFTHNPTNQAFSDAFTYYTGYGWFDPDGVVGITGPVINEARSFFAQNLGANTNWVQTLPGPAAMGLAAPSAGIQNIRVVAGTVTLNIRNPGGTSYNVQFSPDGSSWSTVAANRTGTTWKGSLPASPQGCFRLANP